MSLIFGSPARFAIEVSEAAEEARLRLWVNGKAFGSWKTSGELIHAVEDCEILLQNLESLSEPALKDKTPEEMFAWMLATPTHALFQKRRKYTRFLGDQMDSLSMFSRTKNGQLEWTFYTNRAKKPKFTTVSLDKGVVRAVCTEYVAWYQENFS